MRQSNCLSKNSGSEPIVVIKTNEALMYAYKVFERESGCSIADRFVFEYNTREKYLCAMLGSNTVGNLRFHSINASCLIIKCNYREVEDTD